MQPESTLGAPAAPSPIAGEPPQRFKIRLRFRKAGDLRLVSHHDLMHCFERMFRRARLPVARTQGFNPRPRMSFALSLALGVIGQKEVLELELTEPLSADEVHARMAAQCPPGIEILSAQTIDVRAGAHVRRAFYRLPLARPPIDLAERCSIFLNQPHHWVERSRPQPRRLDLRAYVNEVQARGDGLEMAVWVTPHGAARPEEVVEALGLTHLLNEGAALERTDLELEDELPVPRAGQPGPPALAGTSEPLLSKDSAPRETDVSPRATPLLPGPLSFDS